MIRVVLKSGKEMYYEGAMTTTTDAFGVYIRGPNQRAEGDGVVFAIFAHDSVEFIEVKE